MPSPSGCLPITLTSGAAGPVTVNVIDESSPLTEKTQMSTTAVPFAGRVSTTGAPPNVHEFCDCEKSPIAAIVSTTFGCGAGDPAADGSTTMMSFPLALGLADVSGITSGVGASCATTKFTMFENVPSGFCICTLKLPAAERSEAARVVVQSPFVSQKVVRAVPPTRITEPGPGLLSTKFPPCTRRVNPPALPESALAGSSPVIAGVVAIVTLALAVRDVSSELVATMLIEFGEGAEIGAVKIPADEIPPHGEPTPEQPAPVTFHVTL
jgi:hypothetical protein